MTAPQKPWERPGVNRQSAEAPPSTFMSSGPMSGLDTPMSGSIPAPIGGGDAPLVPSRPSGGGYNSSGGYGGQMGAYNSSPYSYGGSYGSSYGGMNNSPYSMYGGGYGGYGSMGGMGSMGGYNRLGQTDMGMNSFSRQAEESSRPAFQSIESIVGAFSSVSMMLDSTFQAVYNSFRAVIGVADNFSRMRMQFAQIFSAFALFRTLRWLYRKLLVVLRLRPQGYAEEAWTEAGDAVVLQGGAAGPGGKKSSWPVFMFFAIILGAPWLIWKLLQSTLARKEALNQGWASGAEDHFVAQALYDFKGEGVDELSFKAGQNISIAPKELQPRMKGWLLASVNGETIGIIPANYVKVRGRRRGTNQQNIVANQGIQGSPNDSSEQTGLNSTNSFQNLNTSQDSDNNVETGTQSRLTAAGSSSAMDAIFEDANSTGPGPSAINQGPSRALQDRKPEDMDAEDILDQSS